ncbi:MAG: hypothetical protein D6732_26515 [Methanobacteriota archaeon]|nr:MAG: hypothetical protein D6732_26515 [Euryarchaeota archaeon]
MFIDTHIDTLWAMKREEREFSTRSEKGHVDLPRAQEADLLCGFFTGFPTESHHVTEKMLKEWLVWTRNPENKLVRIRSMNDLEKLEQRRRSQKEKEREIGAVLCLEGAAGIDSELNRLDIYYEIGLRSMGLTWNEENQFATGQAQGNGRGLTAEGKNLVTRMEELGIIVDVSHLNDTSFWNLMDIVSKPVIASHSNVRELADHPRNLTKEMVEAVQSTGGTIGINFYKAFLETDPEKAGINSIIRMFEAVIDIADTKTVHVGADLDGCTLPPDLKDITDIPKVLDRVQEELSLTNQDMERIRTGNIKRVMTKVWK